MKASDLWITPWCRNNVVLYQYVPTCSFHLIHAGCHKGILLNTRLCSQHWLPIYLWFIWRLCRWLTLPTVYNVSAVNKQLHGTVVERTLLRAAKKNDKTFQVTGFRTWIWIRDLQNGCKKVNDSNANFAWWLTRYFWNREAIRFVANSLWR